MPPKGTAKGKKGSRKKQIDPFLKKEWYVIKVPTHFDTPYVGIDSQTQVEVSQKRQSHRIGYSPANKNKAKKALDNRTFEICLGDLQKDPKSSYKADYNAKKYQFITEEVFGQQLLTQWHGMNITRDQRCSLIRKWYSMIQLILDCKTTDGYTLRIQALAFTKRQITQVKKNCYAKNSQARAIRARMKEIIKSNVSSTDLKGVINKLSEGKIGTEMRKSCQLIFPLKLCLIEKVRVIKRPKKDVAKLMQIHDLEVTFDLSDKQETGDATAATTAAVADEGDGDDDDEDDDEDEAESNPE